MIPLELQKDSDGLLYLEDNDIFKKPCLNIDRRENIDEYYKTLFYPIPSTSEYIIKYNCREYTKRKILEIKEMLSTLIEKQKNIKSVDFPIAYFVYMNRLSGLIVKYYEESISCDNVFNLQDIEALGKYYYHDEDNIRNLFMLFNDILSILQELIANDVYYFDINPGNFVISNNQVKIIDFDYRFMHFEKKELPPKIVYSRYFSMIRKILYNLSNHLDSNTIEETKVYMKKLENKIYRG